MSDLKRKINEINGRLAPSTLYSHLFLKYEIDAKLVKMPNNRENLKLLTICGHEFLVDERSSLADT
jgi:hypothetical protein